MPKLKPVNKGTFEPVTIELDNGETLIEGKAPAQFTRAEAKRVSCYPEQLTAWLKADKSRDKKRLGRGAGNGGT